MVELVIKVVKGGDDLVAEFDTIVKEDIVFDAVIWRDCRVR